MCDLKLIPARMTGGWRRELADGLSQRPSPRVSDIRKVTGPLCPPTACAAGFHPKHSGGKRGIEPQDVSPLPEDVLPTDTQLSLAHRRWSLHGIGERDIVLLAACQDLAWQVPMRLEAL